MKPDVIDESKLLKPKNPKLSEDDWVEIPLTNVDVFDAGTKDPANLLLANEHAPVDIVGKLSQLPADLQQIVLDRTALPTTVAVRNVQHFAYGQDDAMDIILWADGRAGWFKIKTCSKAYKPVYKEMTEAVTVLYFLVDLLGSKKGRKLSADMILKKYVEQPESKCKSADRAAEIFKKHSRFLISKMQPGQDLSNCRNTAIYEYLQTIADPSSEEDEDTSSSSSNHATTPALDSEAEALQARRLAGKGKSSLRPRSSVYSSKSAGRRYSNDEDEEMVDVLHDPSPTTRKRKQKGAQSTRPRKRAATSEPSDTSNGDTHSQEEHPLPLRSGARRRPLQETEPVIKIIEEPLPSYEPQDPKGDVWTCTFDGCSQRIYNASTEESKGLIKEHYRVHAFESQKQLDLVYKEERPYLPVSNLIKRIREMAAAHKGPTTGLDLSNSFPKPIERRY